MFFFFFGPIHILKTLRSPLSTSFSDGLKFTGKRGTAGCACVSLWVYVCWGAALIKAFLIEWLLYESPDSTSDVDFTEFTSSSGPSLLPTQKRTQHLRFLPFFCCAHVCSEFTVSGCKDESNSWCVSSICSCEDHFVSRLQPQHLNIATKPNL